MVKHRDVGQEAIKNQPKVTKGPREHSKVIFVNTDIYRSTYSGWWPVMLSKGMGMVVVATIMSATARDTMWRFGGVWSLKFLIQVMMTRELDMIVKMMRKERG